MKALLTLALLLPIAAQAQEIENTKPSSGITTVALDASVGLRTFTIAKNRRYSHLRIGLLYVKGGGASATTLTVTCNGTMDKGVSPLPITSTAISAGVGTVSAYSDSIPVSVSSNWPLGYDLRGYDTFSCIVGGTGATSTHTITVQLSVTAGL